MEDSSMIENDDKQVEEIINEFIMENENNGGKRKQVDGTIRRLVRSDPEKAWEIILGIINLATNEELLVDIGVGHLENLLAIYPDQFIAKVEKETKDNPKFVRALEFVWRRSGMSNEFWQRLKRSLHEQWRDDIIVMQQLLRENSYDLGEEEGIIGEKTQDAIEKLRVKTGQRLESIEEIIDQLKSK
jgi:hypothetical protein